MDSYKPTEAELKVINEKFAKEPYKSIDDLYVFPAMIVDNQMTAYFTRVHPDFLKQCVKDLAKGVVFLVGHDKEKLNMAKSFKGKSITSNDVMEVFAKFFMQKDLEVNGINTDDFMRAYLGGTLEDVSIGFAAKRWECSICKNDIRDLKCKHWPGKRYNNKDEEVEKGGTLCFAWVKEPAGPAGEALLEVSACYKGAVPKAKMKKPSDVPRFAIELVEGKKLKEMPLDMPIAMNFSAPLISNEFNIDKFFAGEYSEEELEKIELTAENVDVILAQEVSEDEAKRLKELATANSADLSILLKKYPAYELLHAENEYARWTRTFINSLPNSAFAVIEPASTKGETDNKNARHFPHHNDKGELDLPHLKNALARMNQIKPVTNSISKEELQNKASSHLEKHRSALEGEKQAAEIEELKIQLEVANANNKTLIDENAVLQEKNIKQTKKIEFVEAANLQLQKERTALEPKAKDGEEYRKDLIKEILDLGVKLHGNNFDKDNYEKILNEPDRSLDDIKKMRSEFWNQLCEKFPVGKHTLGPAGGFKEQKESEIPDEAYKI